MEIKESYLHTDTDYETIYKNKHNIVDLYAQIILLSELTGKSFEELGKLVGNYDQDINGNLDASKSVIENLSIVAENLTSVKNRVNANEQRLTSVESRVKRIEDDGIGNYIGTYRTRDNDDSSTLPNPAQDKDRAITEYLSGDDYKYQEWEWNKLGNNTWDKLGVELDSHIHSQSGGITLADVANQQDPKIAKKVDTSGTQIWKGQVLSFAEQKTIGGFADRTLFSETAIPKGYAIVGGTGGSSTKGSIPATTATQAPHKHSVPLQAFKSQFVAASSNYVGPDGNTDTDTQTPAITIHQSVAHNTSGEVLPAGIELVAYVYTALKDITFAEMGK